MLILELVVAQVMSHSRRSPRKFAMGLEFKIETYDSGRTKLPELLRSRPDFLREEEGMFHLGDASGQVLFSVKEEESYVYVCQHVASEKNDALLGLLIRRILSLNDAVVISEL
ncbi:MAG TPA: hypothetical protein PL015_12250 [Opitutaceae bacterium]|nr:hypothetical protein [Opitutaceae bacterium]